MKFNGYHMTTLNSYPDFAKFYYDIEEPTSYRGIETVKSKLKRKEKQEYKRWLRSQPTYAIHSPAKLKFKRNRIVSPIIDHV